MKRLLFILLFAPAWLFAQDRATSQQILSGSGNVGTVTSVTSANSDLATVANTTSTPLITIITGAVVDDGTGLSTQDQIHDYIASQIANFITKAQTTDSLNTRLASYLPKIDVGDSINVYIAGKVNYTDSVTKYVTPTQLETELNALPGGHDAVTLAGEDYLSLSTQQITANEIDTANINIAEFSTFVSNHSSVSSITGNESAFDGWDKDSSDDFGGAYSSLSGIPSTFAPAAHTFGSHSDVTITSIASGEIFKWDGSKVINNTLAEAGIQPAGSYLTSETDGSVSNEGSFTVSAGASNTSVLNSNTSGSTAVTLQVAGINTISEAGNTITITGTEVDGSTTNEIELPSQTGNNGKYLTTDGSNSSWATVASGVTNHSLLSSLDYASAGHTGFQPTLVSGTSIKTVGGVTLLGSGDIGIIGSAYGGTGNGFTKFSGATTAEKTYTLPDASATLLYSGGALGTPSSGTLTNCTFPTFNQNTSGYAESLKSASTTGLFKVTGIAAGATRTKTTRDADDTFLELGGSYTPTGTWSWTSASVTWPTFNQNTSGTAAGLSSTLAIASGGTAKTSFTAYMPITGGTTTTGALQSVATGTQYYPLCYNTSSSLPSFQLLPVAGGGTGKATVTANSYLKGNNTSALVERTYAEVKTDLSLNLVENTALSTWAGTTNITTIGTLTNDLTVSGKLTPLLITQSNSATSVNSGLLVKKAAGTSAAYFSYDEANAAVEIDNQANVATNFQWSGSTKISISNQAAITLKHVIDEPATPASGYGVFFSYNDAPYWKDDNGTLTSLLPTSAAPTNATYITQTTNATLSAEQALSSLSTGLLKNTTGTGVLSIAAAGTDYQAVLVSGTNIKTVNSTSLLGSGDIAISGSTTLTVQTLTYNATNTTMDYNSGAAGLLTLTGNVTTLTLSNVPDGGWGDIIIIQNATGGYGVSDIAHSGLTLRYKDGLHPTAGNISSAASGRTVLSYIRRGSYLYITFGRFTA